jgi:hypothetical protein
MCYDGVWVVLRDTSFPLLNTMQYDFPIALVLSRLVVTKLLKRIVMTTALCTPYSNTTPCHA